MPEKGKINTLSYADDGMLNAGNENDVHWLAWRFALKTIYD
jgi:hypothetical protein